MLFLTRHRDRQRRGKGGHVGRGAGVKGGWWERGTGIAPDVRSTQAAGAHGDGTGEAAAVGVAAGGCAAAPEPWSPAAAAVGGLAGHSSPVPAPLPSMGAEDTENPAAAVVASVVAARCWASTAAVRSTWARKGSQRRAWERE